MEQDDDLATWLSYDEWAESRWEAPLAPIRVETAIIPETELPY